MSIKHMHFVYLSVSAYMSLIPKDLGSGDSTSSTHRPLKKIKIKITEVKKQNTSQKIKKGKD